MSQRRRYDDRSNAYARIDTGIGIPPDQQEKVFEEFHQLNNSGRDIAEGNPSSDLRHFGAAEPSDKNYDRWLLV